MVLEFERNILQETMHMDRRHNGIVRMTCIYLANMQKTEQNGDSHCNVQLTPLVIVTTCT